MNVLHYVSCCSNEFIKTFFDKFKFSSTNFTAKCTDSFDRQTAITTKEKLKNLTTITRGLKS